MIYRVPPGVEYAFCFSIDRDRSPPNMAAPEGWVERPVGSSVIFCVTDMKGGYSFVRADPWYDPPSARSTVSAAS